MSRRQFGTMLCLGVVLPVLGEVIAIRLSALAGWIVMAVGIVLLVIAMVDDLCGGVGR